MLFRLGAVLFLGVFLLTPPLYAGRCDVLAAQIAATFKKNHDVEMPRGRFFSSISIPVNDKTVRQAFVSSMRMWEQEFRSKKIKRILKEIVEGDADIRKKHKKFLKDQRRKAVLIRSIIHTLGKPNSETDVFDEFVKDLGKLNDGLEKEDEKFTKKRAKTLLESLPEIKEQDLEAEVAKVLPTTVIDRLTRERNDLYAKLTKTQMKAEEYHKMRKQMRDFLHVLRVFNEVSPDSKMEKAFRLAEAIGEKIDRTHRKVALKTLGDKDEYHEEIIELDPQIVSQIRRFLDSLRFE